MSLTFYPKALYTWLKHKVKVNVTERAHCVCKYKGFCVQDVAACATSSQRAPWVVLLVLTPMENVEQEPGWMKTPCPVQAQAPASFKSALFCQDSHSWQLSARFPPGEMHCCLWGFFSRCLWPRKPLLGAGTPVCSLWSHESRNRLIKHQDFFNGIIISGFPEYWLE